MPESPEVQALTDFLAGELPGRRVAAGEVEEYRALKTRSRPLTELIGATVREVRRFGKHLDVGFSAEHAPVHLVVSFGRAGWAVWNPPGAAEPADSDAAPAPVIVRVRFDDGAELALTDAGDWLSLGVSVVDDPREVAAVASLGPDPLAEDFTPGRLDAVLIGRRKQLKALLQEQDSLAGIGNAYSDEILHLAKLPPTAHASTLDAAQRAELYTAVRTVLGEATAARRSIPIAGQKAAKVAAMRVHGRTGEACPVCGGTIEDVPGSKGAAQYCPACQS